MPASIAKTIVGTKSINATSQKGDDAIGNGFQFCQLNLSDITSVPPLDWSLGKFILRSKITLLVSPGGHGKSMLTLQWAAALACGVPEPAGLLDEVTKKRVFIINNEDDLNDMYRRLHAIRKHFCLNVEDLNRNIFI